MFLMMFSLLDDEQREFIERLFGEDKPFFFRVARGILETKENADDAVSDAFLRIVDNLDKISKMPRNKMRAYCVTIVKNCAREKLRKDKRLRFTEEPGQYISEMDKSTEDRYFKTLRAAEIHGIISCLSEDEQQLLFLRYADRKTYKEISSILQ